MPRGFLCGIDEGAPVSRFHAEKTRERAVMPACERALCPDQVERAYFCRKPAPDARFLRGGNRRSGNARRAQPRHEVERLRAGELDPVDGRFLETARFEPEIETLLDLPWGEYTVDNFNLENTRKAVEIVNGRYEIESSGGITFDTLRAYAECGVDYISVGALTHSVKGLDMSFKAC